MDSYNLSGTFERSDAQIPVNIELAKYSTDLLPGLASLVKAPYIDWPPDVDLDKENTVSDNEVDIDMNSYLAPSHFFGYYTI